MRNMRQIILFVMGLILGNGSMVAQDFSQLRLSREIATLSKNYVEGYQEKIIQNNFTYHSFRHDLGASMLTRCEETPSPMSWYTSEVPADFSDEKVGFIWIAAMSMIGEDAEFTVKVNGEARFVLPVSSQKDRTVRGDDGAFLRFLTCMTDRHGDGHGYMFMEVPVSWINRGERQIIEIEGSKSGSSTWLIVFEASDAMEYLQRSAGYNALAKIDLHRNGSEWNLSLTTLPPESGDEILIRSGKKILGKVPVVGTGMATVTIEFSDRDFRDVIRVTDKQGEILAWNKTSQEPVVSQILPQGVLKNTVTKSGDELTVVGERIWMPGLVNNLIRLSESDMGQSHILLMNSSHQDIAWMDTPEKCVVERDTMLLTPLFERAAVDPGYRFDIEDALMIREFIQRHPDQKETVRELLADGRISCGATYIQPYEEMYSGEALVRQLYFGKKWLKDEFGYQADTYWNVDVPGRTLQMPQILAKAGVNNMVVTRHKLGFFDWYSPDGSKVRGFSNGHYGDSFTALSSEYYMAMDYLAGYSFKWQSFYNEKQPGKVVPLLSDWDMSPAKDYSRLIDSWNSVRQLTAPDGRTIKTSLPELREVLAPQMFEALAASNPQVDVIKGERPALWLYIHGPSHQQAMKMSREADILLPQAEKVATINGLLDGTFASYPAEALQNAWEAKIYPDHGWGGKGGDITDAFFASRYQFAKAEAEKILEKELWKMAAHVKPVEAAGRQVFVFNSLSWERSSPVTFSMSFPDGEFKSFLLTDDQGLEVPVQILESSKNAAGFIDRASFVFIASEVPSLGYRTYRLTGSHDTQVVPMPKQGKRLENEFYVLEFGQGGLTRIYDKELDEELIDASGFAAGEVFTMRSVGNGAGEFAQVQQPDMVGFDKTGNRRTEWKLVHEGPVMTEYVCRQPIKHAVAELHVRLYKSIKKLDFDVALLNWEGILYREFRMALPIKGSGGKVVYEVPYGKLEVGLDEMEGDAGERYTTPAKEIHPRAIQNWVNVSQPDFSVTLSSSVVAMDYLDPTGLAGETTFIQPILLASRRSCHGLGNEYLQTGDHSFSFSLRSHQPGWENGYRFGIEANEKLLVVTDYQAISGASLPSSASFFNPGKSSILLSVIKKAEDSNGVVIRGVEMEGKNARLDMNSWFKTDLFVPLSLIEEEGVETKQAMKQVDLKPFEIGTFKLTK